MKKVILVLVFLTCLGFSCQKEQDSLPQPAPSSPATNYNYLDAAMMPYKFKAGTYWVYENDSTGLLDSITVDSVSSGFFISVPSAHGTTGQTLTEFYKM